MDGLTPFLQNLTGGLLIGGIYALIGVGLSLIFGVMRVINFAHGEFVAIGMYTSMVLFRQLGIDPYLALVIALPAGVIVGALVQRVVLARLVDSPGDSTLLATRSEERRVGKECRSRGSPHQRDNTRQDKRLR